MKCRCGHKRYAHTADAGCMTRLKADDGTRLGACGCPQFVERPRNPTPDLREGLRRFGQHDDDCATTRRSTAACTCGLAELIGRAS